MKRRTLLLTLVSVAISALLISIIFVETMKNLDRHPVEFYFGITADGTVEAARRLIDKTKDFANLLVISNPDVVRNETDLKELCEYAVSSGFSFFVRMEHHSFWEFNYNPIDWIENAELEYGESFLGIYLFDEPGGNQLDRGGFRMFDETTMPPDYLHAANTYVYYLFAQMRDFIKTERLVTADYGLFWFDYEAGYDMVFCEFGKNRVKEINIALCRGAAEMHNKTWGAMVTWYYDDPPYMESASEFYRDLVTAYEAGAKYIAVFNYPEIGQYGLLTEDHFKAMKQFKQFITDHPQNLTSNSKKYAYVLPEDYGWGLRNPQDKIWGVWEADGKSEKIWNDLELLIEENGFDFDLIYDCSFTRLFAGIHYKTLQYPNSTIKEFE